MAMVVRANKDHDGIGGTYHVCLGRHAVRSRLQPFLPAARRGRPPATRFTSRVTPRRATPGLPRRPPDRKAPGQLPPRTAAGGGLSCYPHPWLMPDFWEFPTVSMGLGPIMAIYQARFNHYLAIAASKDLRASTSGRFLGDGECDEPETLGAITLAAREKLDNLIFVINCNLQRLDGPVRGNGKIIQELEARLPRRRLERHQGHLGRRLGSAARQATTAACWSSAWAKWWTASIRSTSSCRAATSASTSSASIPNCSSWSKHMSDEQLSKLTPRRSRSGEGVRRLSRRRRTKGRPTVILRQDHQRLRPGRSGEGRNITHQQKKLERRRAARVPHALRHSDLRRAGRQGARSISRAEDSPEMKYLRERAQGAGRLRAERATTAASRNPNAADSPSLSTSSLKGAGDREASRPRWRSSRSPGKLLKRQEHRQVHRADRPRRSAHLRHGSVFRQIGIYAHAGQLYEPVDSDMFAYYREAQGRADSRRRHHRSRLDVVVHRRRHRLFDSTACT